MLTPTAQKFVGIPTFQALSGRPVLTDEWNTTQSDDGMTHITRHTNRLRFDCGAGKCRFYRQSRQRLCR